MSSIYHSGDIMTAWKHRDDAVHVEIEQRCSNVLVLLRPLCEAEDDITYRGDVSSPLFRVRHGTLRSDRSPRIKSLLVSD